MTSSYDFYELSLMTVFASFIGFLLENCWLAVTKGYVDNRNMNLPFLLGYGLVIVFFYIFVGTPDSMKITKWLGLSLSEKDSFILYFLLSAVLVSVGELMLGTFVEHKFGFEYWNYTRIPMHIMKYTSVPTSLCFGMAITLFMKYGFDAVMSCFRRLPVMCVKVAGTVLMVLLVADFIMSFSTMYRSHSLYIKWVKWLKR